MEFEETFQIDLIKEIEKRCSYKGNATGEILSRFGMYFFNNTLYAVSGNISSGKTSFILNVINELSIENKIQKTALITLKTDKITIAQMLDSIISLIPLRKYLSCMLKTDEVKILQDASNKVFEAEQSGYFYFEDKAVMKISELVQAIKKINKEKEINIFFIDGINLIVPEKEYSNIAEMITDFSVVLKRLCNELNISIFVTVECLRQNPDNKNIISPSGIRQNADVIFVTNYTEFYNDFNESFYCKKIVYLEKNNFKLFDYVDFSYNPSTLHFTNLIEEEKGDK